MEQIQYITEESNRKISVEENKGDPDHMPEGIAQNRLLLDDFNIEDDFRLPRDSMEDYWHLMDPEYDEPIMDVNEFL